MTDQERIAQLKADCEFYLDLYAQCVVEDQERPLRRLEAWIDWTSWPLRRWVRQRRYAIWHELWRLRRWSKERSWRD